MTWCGWTAEQVLGEPGPRREGWPSNWKKTIPQLAKYYGWSARETEELTGTELANWVNAANEMIEEARENG